MPGSSLPKVTIVGAGLGGSLLACDLGRAGYPVELYELRPDPTKGPPRGGRSINLAISTRGLTALETVGLKDRILEHAVPMRGRMIHPVEGPLRFQPYSRDPRRAIYSVSRAGLNIDLVQAARSCDNVKLHFEHKGLDVDLDAVSARLLDQSTGREVTVHTDILIGADGAFSAVRKAMQRLDRFEYSQSYLEHGYKELSIPPADGGGFRMERDALHIWPRHSYMMIALPNVEGSYTCTLFFPFEGRESFSTLSTPKEAEAFYRRVFPDAVPLMPTLLEDWKQNPVGSLVTVRCHPWCYGGRVALIGDAAHAVVPFYGQGANASFEDVRILMECLREHGNDWGRVFSSYQALRKENADALADLAVENFIEMRDKTSSRLFLMQKKAEKVLAGLLPGLFLPLYSMVTFSNRPYAEAVRRDRLQRFCLKCTGLIVFVFLFVLLLTILF